MSGIGAVGSSGSQLSVAATQANINSASAASSSLVAALLFDPNQQGLSPNVTSSTDSSATSQSSPGLTDLRQQIDAAVTSALQSFETGGNSSSSGDGSTAPATGAASTSSSSSPADVLQAISDAITQTLQKNGIDPQQLAQEGGAGHHHHHHHAESSSGTSSQSTSQSDSSTDSTASSAAGAAGSSSQQGLNLLEQLLQGNSSDSTGGQLASDLFSGGDSSSQNPGLGNLAQLLGSLPNGANVNSIA